MTYLETRKMPADGLTKALEPTKFPPFRALGSSARKERWEAEVEMIGNGIK